MKPISIRRPPLRRVILIGLLLLAAVPSSQADATCFAQAGKKYAIDPLVLEAIANVESAMNARAVNRNRNGTEDLGLMQINSSHLPRLSRQGITREQLLDDACLSVMTGAEILSGFIARFGYTWRAIGAYNSGGGAGRDALRERYAIRVAHQYRRLLVRSRNARASRM